MPAEANELLARLQDAASRMSWEEMTTQVDEFVALTETQASPIDAKTAERFLAELRKKRRFDDMDRAATALREAGEESPQVQRQLVQALIDAGDLEDALGEVTDLIERTASAPRDKEWAEARGLRGRALKQVYVDACPDPSRRKRQRLGEAVSAYLEVFETDRVTHHWHGINVVACAARAGRDGVELEPEVDWRELASEIRRSIEGLYAKEPNDEYNMWAWASAMEASVALGDVDGAGRWLDRYLQSPQGDAFEYASTYRQLVQVWQLGDGGGPLAELLEPLGGALLEKVGGQLSMPWFGDVSARSDRRQATWGDETARLGSWFLGFARKFKAVARVEHDSSAAVGTGFLVPGREILPAWGDAPVFVTAAHVVNEPASDIGVAPADARLRFTHHDANKRFRVRKLLWSNCKLDAAVLQLDGLPDALEMIDLMSVRHLQPEASPRPRLYVIGHPGGRELHISLFDNHLEAIRRPHVLYRSPTKRGHSGAPVVGEDGEAVAVHVAACKDIEANEGVLMDNVLEALRADGPDGPS